MAQNAAQETIAQAIADMAAGLDGQDFFLGASEGLGMVVAQVATDENHAAEFARVLSVNVAGFALAYMQPEKQKD